MNSSETVIKVENLSKCYRIGVKEQIHETIGGAVIDFIKSPLKNYRKYRSLYKFNDINLNGDENTDTDDIIWALRGVSFDVKQGEVLGIIGGNGSGKSTLLKILSKITYPTMGRATIRGNVSSLLEVGTGFNPELTGRENVYLNGTVLGMKKKEVDEKFDSIVEFSGIKKFIDTPVKRYSSGMTVRLAFSVAAHLEPEILLIDEVLAVGDVAFQKKCLGKMNTVAKEGRTVLFVSHNMGAITDLCSRVLWISDGKIIVDGPTMDVVTKYLTFFMKETGYWRGNPPADDSERQAWLTHARIISSNGDNTSPLFNYNERVTIEIGYVLKNSVRGFRSYILLRDSRGHILLASQDTDCNETEKLVREPGEYLSICELPEQILRPGRYYISIGIYGIPTNIYEEEHIDVISFEISEAGYIFSRSPRQGLITPHLDWHEVRK
jgi:lipopolysaccharide transport system ATP-binding protein